MGLILGGALTEVSWRFAFLVNVPVGLVMIYLARTTLRETHKERLKLDATGAILATLGCTAAVFGFTQGPENGWLEPITIGSLAAAAVFLIAFLIVERTAENPVVPFDTFRTSWATARYVQGSASSRSSSRSASAWRCPLSWCRCSAPGC
jgi:hypothetical protein